VFAVIGDYGQAGPDSAAVAALVQSWEPEFILTTGDNNYPVGSAETIDANIGQYYHEYIYPYAGAYGAGATENRFYPSLGNHDVDTARGQAYLDYFELPGNERYYEFTRGPVHFFILNSDSREPDGVARTSVQAAWLQAALAAAPEPWKIVVEHAPPYSSGLHGSTDWMRWPYQEWGASIVLSGHDHLYERLVIDGFPYLINGLGGFLRYRFNVPLAGSMVRYNADYGALWVEATEGELTFQFINVAGEVVDSYSLTRDGN
jgi:hypothetical protein